METRVKQNQTRRLIQFIVLPGFFVTLFLGWKYPILGFSVPIVMVMGLVGGMINGRLVCGWLCPRGAFFDRVMPWFSPRKIPPAFLRSMVFRLILMAGLMGLMVYRIMQDPSNWQHWGMTFWVMCVVTTAVGIILAFFYSPRSWCTFCPMGTMQNLCGGWRPFVAIDKNLCVKCKACERVCPVHIPVTKYLDIGEVRDRDCLRCGECIGVCPKNALSEIRRGRL